MTAYNVTLSVGKEKTEASSDKGYGLRKVICQLLENKGLNNVYEVFVRRKYVGSHLDPKRFQIIKQSATEAVNKYIMKVVSDPSDQAAEDV